MAITVNDSVARWTGSAQEVSSASFTPADNSLLVVCAAADETSGQHVTAQTVTGGGLTWTTRVSRGMNELGGGSGTEGYVSIHTAPVTTGASMTLALGTTWAHGGAKRVSAKVYIVTGHNTSSPIGNVAEGNDNTNVVNGSITISGAGRMFGSGLDWQQLGTPVSSDVEDSGNYAGEISVMSAYKSTDHAAGGGSASINFDAAGSGAAQWQWVGLEILASASGSDTPITVDNGSLAVAGQDVNLLVSGNAIVNVDNGSITIAGQDITLTAGSSVVIPVTNTTLTLAGSTDIGFQLTVPWDDSTLVLSPSNITLTAAQSLTLAVDNATLTAAGQDVTLRLDEDFSLGVTEATLTLAGQDVTFQVSSGSVTISVDNGTLTLTGQNVGVNPSITISSTGSPRRRRFRGIRRILNAGR